MKKCIMLNRRKLIKIAGIEGLVYSVSCKGLFLVNI